MNFRSLTDLIECTRRNLHRVPREIDLVVGVPRSGMMPATQIALARNLPVIDLPTFLERRSHNPLYTHRPMPKQNQDTPRKVLIVDDSVGSGSTLRRVRNDILTTFPERASDFVFLCVYVSGRGLKEPDIFFEKVSFPRIFEWNLFYHKTLGTACVDIDGILCRDPTALENDDGPRYRNFLATVPPEIVPSVRIGWLVTSRLEKYRQETSDWLDRHNIRWDNLVMLDLPSMQERQRAGNHGRFKGEIYRDRPARMFIESEPKQAAEIARVSGKDVICPTDWRLYQPDMSAIHLYQEGHLFTRRVKNRLIRLVHRLDRV